MNANYKSYREECWSRVRLVIQGWQIRTCFAIEREAKARVPRAMALTAKSIRSYINWPDATVVINTPYARFVEGVDDAGNPCTTRRHFVPYTYESMRRWAELHGLDTEKSTGLVVWGYRVPFFSGAIEAVRPQAVADLQRLRI